MKNFKLIGLLIISHLILSPSLNSANIDRNPDLANAAITAAIEYAITRDNVDMIRILFEAGTHNNNPVNPNQTNHNGDTMLHLAVINNNANAAVELVRQGANPFIENGAGQTIFEIGAPSEITDLILETFNQTRQQQPL